MDRELLDLYEAELKHLRTHADEFAAREPFRRIAGRLGLSPNTALRDPFVEWLLQGFAFLAARLHRKLEAEFPRFSQNLLSVVYPHLSAPTPSMIVAEFAMRPDPETLGSGVSLARGTRLSLSVRDRGAGQASRSRRVVFTTGRAVRLWPVEMREVRYLPDAAAVTAAGASRAAPAAVMATLAVTPQGAAAGNLGSDALDLFCADGSGGALLFEALGFATAQVELARGPRLSVVPLGLDRQQPGMPAGEDATDALLPCDARTFDGWRLLHEFLALPARFHFVRVEGLARAVAGRSGDSVTLLFLLDRPFPALAGRLGPESLRPNCVPAVNLFRQAADDLAITERRSEHPILPDRADPTGYEVHSVLAVRGVGRRGEAMRFRPFFARDGFGAGTGDRLVHYHVNRTPRPRPALRETRDASLDDTYTGSDAWLCLVDETGRPVEPDLKSLSLDLLCTNRHLASHALIDAGGPPLLGTEIEGGWRSIRVVAGPSAPRSGLPEGRRLWDAISHLSLNHLALVDAEGTSGAAADTLRQTLRLYAADGDVDAGRLIDGLRAVAAAPTVRRIPPPPGALHADMPPMAFARGLDIALTLDDAQPASATLAAVLDRVLAGQADVNGFVTCRLLRPDGRERVRFAPRSGTRALL